MKESNSAHDSSKTDCVFLIRKAGQAWIPLGSPYMYETQCTLFEA